MRPERLLLVLLLSAALIVLRWHPTQLRAEGMSWRECLRYEPTSVTLSGTLAARAGYGPPNYGETPDVDEKLTIYSIVLTRPVDVCGDSSDSMNRESFQGLREIQLNFWDSKADPRPLVGRKVLAKGSLYAGYSGYHFTPVLLRLTKLTVHE